MFVVCGARLRLHSPTLREAVLYFVRHKEEVNRWASGTTKLDASLIDRVSRANRNYGEDRLEQIGWMREALRRRFGVDATGLWLTERVWEPELAADLADGSSKPVSS